MPAPGQEAFRTSLEATYRDDAGHDAGPRRPWKSDRLQRPLFVLPACVVLLSLTVYPFVYSVYLSLYRVRLTNLHHKMFLGVENYLQLLQDSVFFHSLCNTFALAVVGISIEVVLGYAVAKVFLELRHRRAFNVLRSFYLMPMMITPLTVGVIFAYIFNPTIGIANQLFQFVDIPAIPWFGQTTAARCAILLIDVWQNTPFMMLLILAGLLTIPGELYEAARMDGARALDLVRHIEVPAVLGVILLGVILRLIDILRFFDVIYVTTRGGPGDSTMVLTLYAYQQDFEYFQIGSGSAAAVVILAISIVITTVAVSLLRRIERG